MRKAMQAVILITFIFAISVIATPIASATIGPINGHTLITEPDDGTTFLVNQINSAQSTIAITIYEFDNSTPLYGAILAAAQRGVKVDITYNYSSFASTSGKQQTVTSFMQSLTQQSSNIQTHPASNVYEVTHQKGIVIDGKAAFICSFNFLANYFSGTRDFGIFTTIPAEVNEVAKVAAADFIDNNYNQNGTAFPGNQLTTPELAWSNYNQGNSRTKLSALIQSAKSSIFIYQELVEDQAMINVICNAIKANPKLDVRIIAPQLSGSNGTDGNLAGLNQIKQAGGRYIEVPSQAANKLYVHAKMILVDYNNPIRVPATAAAYIGSINFSTTSLDKNRETGIVIKEQPIMASIYKTFMSDWNANGGNL